MLLGIARTLLAKKMLTILVVFALVGVMLAQMLFEARLDGASTDEQIHILSGYATLTQGHVLFDPEHPFLAKTLAALPLLFIRPNVPTAAEHLTPEQSALTYNTYREANQWGFQMLFQSGNDPDEILFWTRAVIAVLTAALALVIFWWVKSVWGPASGLAALTLVAFEPSLIAHGHLANDDTVSTLFFIASLALFWRFLHKPDKRNIIATGIVLGLGLITKYSLLLLGPIFVLILIIWLIHQYRGQPAASMPHTEGSTARGNNLAGRSHRKILAALVARTGSRQPAPATSTIISWKRYAFGLLAIFIIAWGVIWAGYSSLAIINPAHNPTSLVGVPGLPDSLAHLGSYVLPAMYSKGAVLLFGPGSHGRDGYLLGACYQGGRWDYFPVVTFFKTPLATLLLLAIGLWAMWRHRRTVGFLPIVLGIAAALYLCVSSQSDINIGYRHFLPIGILLIVAAAYPFSLINCSSVKLAIAARFNTKSRNPGRDTSSASTGRLIIVATLAVTALLASVVGSLSWYPNHLAYYNILSGEPHNRPFISADSNADWGQATPALYRYMLAHGIDHLALDNFTGTSEAEARGYPITPADPLQHDYSGYIALSRSTIIDHYCQKNNDWGWLVDNFSPVAIVGGSINLYKLP